MREDESRSGSVLRRKADGSYETIRDDVCTEEPLEIRLGDEPLVVTMRTPGSDEELAAGFLLAEGVIRTAAQIRKIEPCTLPASMGNVIRVLLATDLERKGLESQTSRRSAIAASCGVCGKRTIEDALALHGKPLSPGPVIREEIVLGFPGTLRTSQATFDRTGGLHAAGLFQPDGSLVVLREDVGRHNAVDKVIGHALLKGFDLSELALMVSGRVSFEIVQKACAAGIGLVAAVSAPSSLAIHYAREAGLTLIGFLRPPQMNLYSHPQRIQFARR